MKVKLLFPLFALFFSMSYSQIGINQPSNMVACDDNINDGLAVFDLDLQTPQILGGLNPNDYNVTYHVTQADANQQTNPLISPYSNTINFQIIFVSVFENATGNFEITSFNLIVNTIYQHQWTFNLSLCDDGVQDGINTFDLTGLYLEFINGNEELSLSYFETYQDAIDDVNVIANPTSFTNTVPFSQDIYIRVEDPETSCFYVYDQPALILNVGPLNIGNEPTPYEVCDLDGDGFFTFDLETKTDEILSGNSQTTNFVSYHETLSDADNATNELPNNYTNIVASNQVIFARVYRSNGCYGVVTLELVVETNCILASPVSVDVCGGDPNIPFDYDLTPQETNIVNGQDPLDFSFSYYISENDAENETNSISNPQAFNVSGNSSTLYVRIVENATGNFGIVEYDVNFNLNPQINLENTYSICSGDQIVLTPSLNGSNGYTFLWNTGSTDPEIAVSQPGVYSVSVIDSNTGCTSDATTEVIESQAPILETAADLSFCGPNSVFDLSATIPEILNVQDPNQFVISFYTNLNSANANNNPIANTTSYVSQFSSETIFVRVQNIGDDCYAISDFTITSDGSCPIIVDCGQEPINTTFCYSIGGASDIYRFESSDNSPLQVIFNAGQVEVDYDALIVLDSDGTNLNPIDTEYGNNGDLTGLSFTSSGSSISILVDSDNSISCDDQNYTSIDFDVNCLDVNAIPNCDSSLITPTDGGIDVNENSDLSWTTSTGLVNGYNVSLGITSGGTEILDNQDVGDVLTYDIGTLDFEVIYYVTITPYNDNGDAENCIEETFTTRANPNQVVICDNGAVNTTYCYGNDDNTEFNFQSSDGAPLTIFFNSGSTEVDYDTVSIIDSDGTVLNPNLPYGNDGDFSGLSFTSSGDSITLKFQSDDIISCGSGANCCTVPFDFDVICTSSIGIINVNAFLDDNVNSIFDANEFSFSNGYFTYEVNGDGIINNVSSSTGGFQIIAAETDTYTITFNLNDELVNCYDLTTAIFNGVSVTEGNAITIDFPVVVEQSCEDLAVYLINYWTPPRPGFTYENNLVLENLGLSTITSGTVEFTHDPLLIFNGITVVNPNYTITNTATGFTLDFVNLQPGDIEYIDISLTCPASIELEDIVTNTTNYITDTNDLVASNNYSTLSELVVGSWDPNDKRETHGPRLNYDDFAASDEWLYYTIRFQNLGTFAAEFLRIEDALDNKLDESSFQMLRSSHDYVVTRTDTDLEWFFEDINLPAEQDDAEGSQGFVYFRIKPNSGYVIGDIIPNTAAIFFDFNAPVITNRFDTEFVDDALSVQDSNFIAFDMFPNPAKDKLTIQLKVNTLGNVTINIIDLQGKLISEAHISEGYNLELDIADLQSGLYFVKLTTNNRSLVKKLIIE